MSRYSDISKMIGWSGSASVPTIQRANELHEQVKEGNLESFTEVFKIHRFAQAVCEEDIEPMNIIFKAFTEGEALFK